MATLKINTGVIRLTIEDGFGNERGVFAFNPEDIESAKRVLDLQKELDVKQKEFEQKVNDAEAAEDKVEVLDEMVTYFKDAIDRVFGEGSSQLLFGDAKTLSMFEDFFDGITPYYKQASDKRMAKYKKTKGGK